MKLDTLCVQAGYDPQNGDPRVLPIVQSTTFVYDSAETMGKLFDLEADGCFYTRLANPTLNTVAAKIAALEGGVGAMLTASGQAASLISICLTRPCVIWASTLTLSAPRSARRNWIRRSSRTPRLSLSRPSPIPLWTLSISRCSQRSLTRIMSR